MIQLSFQLTKCHAGVMPLCCYVCYIVNYKIDNWIAAKLQSNALSRAAEMS